MSFLLHKYNAPMDYSDNTIGEAVDIEKIFSEYFQNVKILLRKYENNVSKTNQKVQKHDEEMLLRLRECKDKVRNALNDDFDTPKAMQNLKELVKECNKYMAGSGAAVVSGSECEISTVILMSVAKYITYMMKVSACLLEQLQLTLNFLRCIVLVRFLD
jgi:cysteinyl-tRNA synthetase